MDYKEAIEELESLHRHCDDMINEFDPYSVWRADCKALDMAISAMQELQECKNKLEQVYGKCEELLDKVIDTLIQFADEMKIGNPIESLLLTDEEVELWKQIKQLGTLEEVQEAVEKQKRKKPCASNRCYVCPRCGLVTSLRIKHNYCDACGQHIDWSVEE